MNRKIPADAFSYYFSLGPGRSYQSAAAHFGVTKQAITRLAQREDWQSRLETIERQARQKLDENAVESLEGMNLRHMKTLQVIQRKALETLKTMPLASAMEAVRALDMTIGKERLVRGEPTDRAEINVEDVIRREYDRWLVRDGPVPEEHDERSTSGNGTK